MRTTIDLTDEAYHLARAIAHERNESLGKVVSELILGPRKAKSARIVIPDDPHALPKVYFGRRITSDDVRNLEDAL